MSTHVDRDSVMTDRPPKKKSQVRRVVMSGLIGTTIEYYEFFIYGLAASLVFGPVFFPSEDPLVGTLLSLASFGLAYVARPLGGAIFGHFGDRIGRKKVLVVSLLMMGSATTLIGLTPSYETIGIWAPIMLTVCRIVQGVSVGGEYAGAVLMTVEHTEKKKRGFMGGIINTGSSWGMLLANLVFLAVVQLPDEDFMSWGWRIPFIGSAILVVIGLFIRLQLEESPDFEKVSSEGAVERFPIVRLLKMHGGKVALMALCMLPSGVAFYTAGVFSLAYGPQTVGISRSAMLVQVLIMTVIMIIGIPLAGKLGDRFERRKIAAVGAAGLVFAPFAWFSLINTGEPLFMFFGFVILCIPYVANYGVLAAYFAQVFPTNLRFSGVGVGYTLGGIASSAIAPLIATALLQATGSWVPIAIYMAISSAIGMVAAIRLRETPDTITTDLKPAEA
ncbi:MHS family MFS transporter [Rhodococcus pyridinivorans]|uniref:MFS transporter n=1 Tax=Rhodococcus pyridinivorans TaxID=103816 RepID=UPI0020C5D266|nr:MFS transporter [Rhodococcus pyridinivorans]UTM38019.1 MHS family MFS transporter [Rhodococcus pyridinivorans]